MAMDERTWNLTFCIYYRQNGEHNYGDRGICHGCGHKEKK